MRSLAIAAVVACLGALPAQQPAACADYRMALGFSDLAPAQAMGGGAGPEDVAYQPATGTLFVAHDRPGSAQDVLLEYDLQGRFVQGVATAPGSGGLCARPGTPNLLLTSGNAIREVDRFGTAVPGGMQFVISNFGGIQDLDFDAAGTLWIADGTGRFATVDLVSGAATDRFLLPFGTLGVAAHPNGNLLAAVSPFNAGGMLPGTLVEVSATGAILGLGVAPGQPRLRNDADPCAAAGAFDFVNGLSWIAPFQMFAASSWSQVGGSNVALFGPASTGFLGRIGSDGVRADGLPFRAFATGDAELGSPGFTIGVENVAPASSVVWGWSVARLCANPPVGANSRLYIDVLPPNGGFAILPSPGTTFSLPVDLSSAPPSLAGFDVWTQFLGSDPSSTPPGAPVTSACLRVHFGGNAPPAGGVSGLSVVPGPTSARLSWNPSAGAAAYDVFRRLGASGAESFLGRTIDPGFDDDHLAPATAYTWRVAAVTLPGPAICNGGSTIAGTTLASPAGFVRVARLDVLVAIYSGGPQPISATDVQRMRQGLELARGFIYRNSRGRLLLDLTVLEIPAAAPSTSGPSYANLAADLLARGVQNDQFDAVHAIANTLSGCFGGFVTLGNTAGSFAVPGCAVDYPLANPAVDTRVTWGFVHEFQHALDLVIAQGSGHPEMLHGHPDSVYGPGYSGAIHDAGEHYDWQREVFASFNAYGAFVAPWNGYVEAADADADGFPDADARFPSDEARFGSSPASIDADADGLGDLQEFAAGLYAGSNPNLADTDGDGRADGVDPQPLVPIAAALRPPAGAIAINGAIEPAWSLLQQGVRFSESAGFTATTYANWSAGGLYVAAVTNQPCTIQVQLDASGLNGFWHGNTTWFFSFAAGGAQVLNHTAIQSFVQPGVALAGSSVASSIAGGLRTVEAFIPANAGQGFGFTGQTTTGFSPAVGATWGLRVFFTRIGGTGFPNDVNSGLKAYLGETWRFDDLPLVP